MRRVQPATAPVLKRLWLRVGRPASGPAFHSRRAAQPQRRTGSADYLGLQRTQRAFCTSLQSEAQLQECLAEHPDVMQSEFLDGIAYVVRVSDAAIDDWELEEYLMVRSGLSVAAVPKVRFVEHLPATGIARVPFAEVHIIDALFREVDVDGNGLISFQEFLSFCNTTKIFNSTQVESHDVFFNARSSPTTSELLFGNNDPFAVPPDHAGAMKFHDFRKLLLDFGLVEVTEQCEDKEAYLQPLVAYFVDERIVDIVLHRWFSMYDLDGDGLIQYKEYVRLVGDYRLSYAVSEEAFQRLCRESGGGLDLANFRTILERAGALKTGASLGKDDEMGKIWRQIKDSQRFLQPSRVFVADGREGTSPAKGANSLRFVCISDTHGLHWEMTPRLPMGDVLLHAGDFSMSGGLEEVTDFGKWLRSLPFTKKVVIAGNHDLSFDRSYGGHHQAGEARAEAGGVRAAFAKACGNDGGIVYLEDEECCIEGISIYGTPWQPEFGCWAFNLPRGPVLAEKWHAVPVGVDILLVHGPPLGRGDATLPSLRRAGCADLLSEVQSRIQPAFCVYGHVHEGAGVSFDGTTHFLNACSVNEHYECVHAPLVFDVQIPDGSGGK